MKKSSIFSYWCNAALIVLFIVIGVGIGGVVAFFSFIRLDLERFTAVDHAKSSIILDCHGNQIAQFATQKHIPISLNNVPSAVWHAFIAIEDRQFFSHHGVSLRGIIRSLWVNIKSFKKLQGGSTITQQLVRLLFLDNKKTYFRKCLELVYTLYIELIFSKEQILEAYLNTVYFGAGLYGIGAACKAFWNISVEQLDIAQSALLAGIVKSPSYYCPFYAPERSRCRRNVVLKAMKECLFLSEEEYEKNSVAEVSIQEIDNESASGYIKEMVRKFCIEKGYRDLYRGGYSIQTTIDQSLQQKIQKIFCSHVKELRAALKMPINGGVVCIVPSTGHIRAVLGGYSFKESVFNRVFAKRQQGSTIKTFIYACLLMNKVRHFTDCEVDEPISIQYDATVWMPKNYNKKYKGSMSYAYALASSNNIIAIKTLLTVGLTMFGSFLQKIGIQTNITPYPSLALGCIDVTLMELVRAFNIFANGGHLVKPYFIEWVKDEKGKKVWSEQSTTTQVIPLSIVSQIIMVLRYACYSLYKIKLEAEVIGKTGTTNDSRTCWFVGATPELTTALYVGCDDNRSMGASVFPIHTTIPIWKELYAHLNHTKNFHYDASLHECIINKYTGERVSNSQTKDTMVVLCETP